MRTVALTCLAIAVLALAGCSTGAVKCLECDYEPGCTLPTDLPPNPKPGQKYCKVWVPPTYREVPKLVRTDCGGVKTETVTVMETRACEVMVEPARKRSVKGCDTRCEQTAVQVKPGGYRWECRGDCYEYKYRPPEYKWCDKTRQEEGIKFCYEEPAKYGVEVTTRPVQRERKTYVPPKYEVQYVKEQYTPGRWEWQSKQVCGDAPDPRTIQTYELKRDVKRACPQPKALDCGCPRTN